MANIKVVAQYIKDLSFETPLSPEIYMNNFDKPDISLNIDIDAKKINENLYEVVLKLSAKADTVKPDKNIFLCEIAYAGLFMIETPQENDMLEQILLIYCPNLLFPYIRKIISGLTMDSNFPPLMLDPIDFADLYMKRKAIIADAKPISDTKN